MNRISFALLALLMCGLGCSKREARRDVSVDSTAVRNPATTWTYREPVSRSDSLINAAAPKLTPWAEMWRKADPEFAPESLRFVDVAPAFRKDPLQPLKAFYPPDEEHEPVFRVLSARSPDNRYNLIFDWYQAIEESNGEIDIGGDADSGPLLLDFRDGTARLFDICGTPCTSDWGAWLSPTKFVLAGADTEGRVRGTLAVYSLEDTTVTSYETRNVSPQAHASYRSAWESWVDSRFRALDKGKPLAEPRGTTLP